MSDEGAGEPTDRSAADSQSDPPKERPRPKAAPAAGPAAQVATVAAAVLVLLVVGIVFALQDAKDPPKPETVVTGETTGPPPSATDSTPSADESLLPSVPTDIPSSLCPGIALTHPLTVLSFNMHGARGVGERVDLGRIAREIKAWKPDVVLLQEVDDGRARSGFQRQAEALGKATDMTWVYGGNHSSGGTGPIGNAILSRYEVVAWQNILLPRAGGREQRGLLHAVLDVEGVEISVYSTHFDHASSLARVAQARASVRQLASDPRPTIFGGDLNAVPGAAPLRQLRAAGLGDAWAVADGAGGTVPARSPRRRIDYVLHDGWFKPLQASVLLSAVSDHRAVWTRVELREEVGCIKVGG